MERLFENNDLGIYAEIDFSGQEDDGHEWRRIGTGRRNADGSFDLIFICWPSKAVTVRLAREKPS